VSGTQPFVETYLRHADHGHVVGQLADIKILDAIGVRDHDD
jgi:hypothetical protein